MQDELAILLHDPEAERALLGAVILGPERYAEISAIVDTSDFYVSQHRIVWAALGKTILGHRTVDLLLLKATLESQDLLEQAGGVAYLATLVDGTISRNAPHYAARTKELSRKRSVLVAMDEIGHAASNGATASEMATMLRVYCDKASSDFMQGAEPLRSLDPMVDPGPIPWLIEGWMAKPEVILFGGEWYSGKSFVSLEAAIALSVGGFWMGKLQTERQCKVLYVDEENPPNVGLRRMRQILTARNIGFDGIPGLRYLSQNGIVLTTGYGAAALEREIKAQQTEVLFLDSLSSVRAGEENSASELQAFVREYLQPLVNRHNLTVVLLDNMGKQTKENRSAGDRIRGTSAKADKGSTIWALSGDKDTVDRILSQEKNRWDEKAPPMALRWQQSDDKSAAWLSCSEEQPLAKDVLLRRLEVVESAGMLQSDLIALGEASGIRDRTCRNILQRLYKERKVKRRKESHKSVRYWIFLASPDDAE